MTRFFFLLRCMRTKSSASKLAKKSVKLREKRFPDFAIYKNLAHIPLNIPKRSFHVFSRHDHPPIHLPSIIPRRLILLPLPNFSHSKIPSPKTSSLFGRLRLIKYSRAGEMRRRACGAFPLSLPLPPPLFTSTGLIRSQRLC